MWQTIIMSNIRSVRFGLGVTLYIVFNTVHWTYKAFFSVLGCIAKTELPCNGFLLSSLQNLDLIMALKPATS